MADLFREYVAALAVELARVGVHEHEVRTIGRFGHPRLYYIYEGREQYVILPGSPSDSRAGIRNAVGFLRRQLGIAAPAVAKSTRAPKRRAGEREVARGPIPWPCCAGGGRRRRSLLWLRFPAGTGAALARGNGGWKRRMRLTPDEQAYALWRYRCRWPTSRISGHLGCAPQTVRNCLAAWGISRTEYRWRTVRRRATGDRHAEAHCAGLFRP